MGNTKQIKNKGAFYMGIVRKISNACWKKKAAKDSMEEKGGGGEGKGKSSLEKSRSEYELLQQYISPFVNENDFCRALLCGYECILVFLMIMICFYTLSLETSTTLETYSSP